MALVQSSNVNSEDSMDIVIHPPNTSEAVFAATTFPYDRLMESWAVVASTLPLWKKRKNVTITYSPLEGVDSSESFLDTVTFNNINSDEGKDPSTVVGIDVHDKNAPDNLTEDREATPTDLNGLRFKWDGKGLLSVSSAKWQVLGFFLAQDSTRRDEDWVVTYFASTLFTPAGLDIYVRKPQNFAKEKVQKLIEVCKSNEDEGVRKVSQEFFEIPRD